MSRKLADWDQRIGRRLRLRDLHVLATVIRLGSMAKAAAELRLTQPAISQAIADLEGALGARLLDRSPRGVSPTIFSEALLRRGTEAFDALRQGIRDIEYLADPGKGEVWVGTSESFISGGTLAAVIAELGLQYPDIAVHVVEANTAAMEFQELRGRKVDMMLGRISGPLHDDDLNVEPLYDEAIVVAAGRNHRLARRRRVELAELCDESWILAPRSTAVRELVGAAFRAKGLPPPRIGVTTYSMQLRMQLMASGRYLSSVPQSLLRFNAERWSLTSLPVVLGKPLSVAVITLRHRTLHPAAQLFIEYARKILATGKAGAKPRATRN